MMRVWMICCTTALLVAGCAGTPAQPREVTSVLEQLATGTDYAVSKRCLANSEYDRIEILDDQHLLVEGRSGDKVWLNTLRSRCPGLRPDDVLAYDMHDNRLCSLDTATVIDRFLFWQRTGPTCSLGEFQELTPAQAGLIREAM